jgi:3-oxoacyl-[acyl-carrier-protein] synthase II
MLSTDRSLVTIGAPCSMSAVGSTDSFLARIRESPEFIGLAAVDAALVEFTDQLSCGMKMDRWLAKVRISKQRWARLTQPLVHS